MDPFRGRCHLFVSSRQQLPATNSSCHPCKRTSFQNIWQHLSVFCLFLPLRHANTLQSSLTPYFLSISCLVTKVQTSLYVLQMEKLRPWSLSNTNIVGPGRARGYIMVGLKLRQAPREGQWPRGRWERIPRPCMPTWSRARWWVRRSLPRRRTGRRALTASTVCKCELCFLS